MSTLQATFTRTIPEDVAFNIDQTQGTKLKAINVNGKKINKTGNYISKDESVKFESTYLETLDNGNTEIEFIMDDGSVYNATLTIEE